MTLLLVMGLALCVLAVVLLSLALRGPSQASGVGRSLAVLEAMTNAPKEMTQELDRPFSERIVAPVQARALGLGRRVTGRDAGERIRRKLDLAGNPVGWTVDRVISGKVIAACVLPLVFLAFGMMLGAGTPILVVLAMGGAVIGFFGPDLYLYQSSYDRAERMQRELADAIDLMTISVEAGLGFDAAVMQVARNLEGPLAEEFSRMLREMQIGQSRSNALRGLAERTTVPELRGFVSAMVQADQFGIPIAQVLRVQSAEMRVKRRQRAEQKAQQVPVKITVPLIFCILPTLFISVLGPAVISILDNF